MAIAVIDEKGRIRILERIREELSLKFGEEFEVKTTALLLFVILFLCLQVSLVSATDPIVENADAVWNPIWIPHLQILLTLRAPHCQDHLQNIQIQLLIMS